MAEQKDANNTYQRYWDYLHILARMQMSPQFAGKIDVSGVVQQTLWEAHAAQKQIDQFEEAQRIVFLRRILANNMQDEIRKFSAAARDIARELSFEAAVDASSQRLGAVVPADQSSPSGALIREEHAVLLADAMATLPEQQRIAIEMHHLQGMKLAEVAEKLNRTKGAVAALLARGMKTLRAKLKEC